MHAENDSDGSSIIIDLNTSNYSLGSGYNFLEKKMSRPLGFSDFLKEKFIYIFSKTTSLSYHIR